MKEQLQYVDFDTAVLLKEAGFGWHTRRYFQINNEQSEECDRGYYENWNKNNPHWPNVVSRPSLLVVSQWLREVKGLHVAVNLTHDGWYWQIISTITGGCLAEQSFINNHDLALSHGITKALELLNNSNKR